MIRYFAIDMDGVLLKDSFSPIIKELVQEWGGKYNAEIEAHVFSRPRKEAAEFIIKYLNLNINIENVISAYFSKRGKYLKKNGLGLNPGVNDLLLFLKEENIQVLCYGGLEKEYFNEYLGRFRNLIREYICTNNFRPGLKEISDLYHCNKGEIVFVDDVATVAKVAKKRGDAFIGMPATWSWGYQAQEMKNLGVKNIISSLQEINIDLLTRIRKDIAKEKLW